MKDSKSLKEYNKEKSDRWRQKHEVEKSKEKYQGIKNIDYVECEICKKRSLCISTKHLRHRHKITRKEYIKRFPYTKLCSKKRAISQARYGNQSNKGKKFSNEHKLKLAESKFGNKNPAWNGGSSYLPYCPIWTSKEFKEYIKYRDKHRCQNPSCRIKLNVRLVIHHIDYTKENCATDNLITLCISCNSRANHKRESWKKFYKRVLHMNSL